jgi:superoxide reductase
MGKGAKSCEEDIFCGINQIKDPDNMTDLEKKHLPVVTAPAKVKSGECFEVTVEIGKLLAHPNEPAHFIEFIDLYSGDTFLARLDLTARLTRPVMKASVCLDHAHGELRAFARCNLHGSWEGTSEIEVTD